jgi:nitrite reductase/ring-hydroxylating ferredoxin subunit
MSGTTDVSEAKTKERAPVEHRVAQAADLPPGKHKIVKVRSLEIGVYNVGGTYYALHSMCPHQFGPACLGPVGGQAICNEGTEWRLQLVRDGEILTCPWHGMEYDIISGQCLSMPRMRLRTFPVRVVDGEVRVQIGGRQTAAA